MARGVGKNPVYPVVVFSYDQPRTSATSQFTLEFPDLAVMRFQYRVIQLNQSLSIDQLNRLAQVGPTVENTQALEDWFRQAST